jgi:hemolysin III
MAGDVLLAERPRMRGWLHTWAFVAAIPAGVLLVIFADRPVAVAAAAIYSAALLMLFGTSAAYHRLAKSYRARKIMQRLDHSMIYVLITGTYVPICLVALGGAWGITILSIVGGLGAVGVTMKLAAFVRLQWVSYALYPIMGWVAIVAGPVLVRSMTGLQLGLVVAGGIAYSIGFPVLLLRRPDPWPKVFGYHEVWHGMTVLAATLHFGAVASVVG